jgi:hypothetical protein
VSDGLLNAMLLKLAKELNGLPLALANYFRLQDVMDETPEDKF